MEMDAIYLIDTKQTWKNAEPGLQDWDSTAAETAGNPSVMKHVDVLTCHDSQNNEVHDNLMEVEHKNSHLQ